ncbi:hypothetical protein CR513_12179, partial [Mucuna pruriens]
MENAKAVSTHLATHFKLSSRHSPLNEAEKTNMSRVPYAFVVGSLMCGMSEIHLGKNSTFHSRSKHIDVRYDALDVKLLELAKVLTDDNGANMMTKGISKRE